LAIGYAIGSCYEQHNAKRQRANRLLPFELLIHREQRIEGVGGAAKQLAISDAGPPKPNDSLDLVTR
jgi:hypothetical protein